jgi:subtilisin family serine protease
MLRCLSINYPLVGVIDSGTDPNNMLLRPWVAIRDEDDVPAVDQDNNHGSFVAGLIANGRTLNPHVVAGWRRPTRAGATPG